MRYPVAFSLICFLSSVVDITVAQAVHVIQVGDTGSFFDPQFVAAGVGDTVSFQWTGKFHSVTQCSFDNPCTPLPGGFDSSVTGNPGQLLLVPTWNLTITDDTQPIWFFCKVTIPAPHCTNGMVGAINAPVAGGNQSFDNFTLKAKTLQNFSASPPNGSAILSGVGAFATATPIPMHNASGASTIIQNSTTLAASTIVSSFPTSTSPAIQVQQNSATGLSTAAIGGIAGGVVGLILMAILLALLFMSYRRGKRYRREAKAIRHLHSKSDMSHIDRIDIDGGHPEPAFTPSQQIVQLHRSQGSLSVNESLERESGTTPSLNIKELAAEIAKNMRQDLNPQDRSGFPPDAAALATVPEQDALSGAGSSGSGRGRQLPRPPQTLQTLQTRADARADVRSVDTLPAYAPGHAR